MENKYIVEGIGNSTLYATSLKDELTKDLNNLINISLEFEKEYITYFMKYAKDEIMKNKLKQFSNDEEIKDLVLRFEKVYLRIIKDI